MDMVEIFLKSPNVERYVRPPMQPMTVPVVQGPPPTGYPQMAYPPQGYPGVPPGAPLGAPGMAPGYPPNQYAPPPHGMA